MNRLKKILLSFVFPFFCLLISVSYGAFSTTPLGQDTSSSNVGSSSSAMTIGTSGYNTSQVKDIIYNYYLDTSNSTVFLDMVNSLYSSGYGLTIAKQQAYSDRQYAYVYNYSDVDIGYIGSSKSLVTTLNSSEYTYNIILKLDCSGSTSSSYQYNKLSSSSARALYPTDGDPSSILYSTLPIKLLTWSGGYKWDGTSYYYEPPLPEEPDAPSLPSNAEIAQAVQAFYNSDYYKNNKEFSDFIVMYNYNTGYFSFIGHNFGSNLGQVIVPPDYEYEGYSYKQDWWKFFLRNISSELASNLWNRYYWLYSTNNFGENITYDGKGAIKDILDIHWATSSIIVYSTTDYPVVKIELDENGVLTPVQGTVSGDQYTYDENLDPTTNEYNPLENFVPTNPSQSILGDVDFNEINKVFEENKDILNIENASWLFSANNQLVSYFLGFLLLLIVFLIISRVLGG